MIHGRAILFSIESPHNVSADVSDRRPVPARMDVDPDRAAKLHRASTFAATRWAGLRCEKATARRTRVEKSVGESRREGQTRAINKPLLTLIGSTESRYRSAEYRNSISLPVSLKQLLSVEHARLSKYVSSFPLSILLILLHRYSRN